MKNLWQTFIAVGLLLAIIQGPSLSETVKIKKILKELKKLKKYGYLLAGQRQKLYAIPFPMPLPVFVKRQHIYTQVPIIHRYVPHPQSHYAAPAMSVPDSPPASYEYSTSDSHYAAPEASYPSETQVSYLPPKSYGSSSQSRKPKQQSSSPNNYQHQQPQQEQQEQQQDQQQQWISSTGKYLSQLANLLSQSSSMLGNGASKEIISKLASGQARVLPPSALFSTIRSPSASALMGAYKLKDTYDQDHYQDQAQNSHRGTKSSTSSNSGSQSPSHNSVSYDDSAQSTETNSTKGSDSSSEIKASPSEMYRTALGLGSNLMRYAAYNPYTSPYRLNPMIPQFVSPLAAMTMAGRTVSIQPGGNLLRTSLGANILPLIDSLGGANQVDQQDDPSSNQQEVSTQTIRDFSRAYQNLLRQRQLHQLLQQQQHSQSQADPLLVSASIQKFHRHQEALRMALLREQEVAARLAATRRILVRANQLGLPIAHGDHQASLLKY